MDVRVPATLTLPDAQANLCYQEALAASRRTGENHESDDGP